MGQHALPKGHTRIAAGVLDMVAMTAARGVPGVIDIVGFAKGAARGVAVLDAPAGKAAGTATTHRLMQTQKRCDFYEMHKEAPVLQLHLSAEYGTDLKQLAHDVREQVRASIRVLAGLEVQDIEVIFTEVVLPYTPSPKTPFTLGS